MTRARVLTALFLMGCLLGGTCALAQKDDELATPQRRLPGRRTSAEAYPPLSPGVMTPISKSLEIGASITMISTLFRRVLTDERRCTRFFR